MTFISVRCPYCHSDQVVKRGKTRRGKQRYLGQNAACTPRSFLLDSIYRGQLPEVKQHIIDMSLNAGGVCDMARVLRISPDTVLRPPVEPDEMMVDMQQAGTAEMDAMGSFVGKTGHQRWVGHAIDHQTGAGLAYVFGRRKDEVFLPRKALLEPFGLTRFYTDHWGACTQHLDPDVHSPGKRHTQKIERKHLTLRACIKRMVRRTIGFSQSTQMHDLVIGKQFPIITLTPLLSKSTERSGAV